MSTVVFLDARFAINDHYSCVCMCGVSLRHDVLCETVLMLWCPPLLVPVHPTRVISDPPGSPPPEAVHLYLGHLHPVQRHPAHLHTGSSD